MIDRIYGKFSGKTPNFSLPWQPGSSEQSLIDIIKLADPENPLVGAGIWGVSPAQAAQIFVSMATRVCPSQM